MNVEIKDYKYKELCSAMGEVPKTGKSKIYQLRNWKRYFNWTNPTKQTYRITEVYDVPFEKDDNRKNNGGARKGSGNKPKLQYEFDCLLNSFLYRGFKRNSYNCSVKMDRVYFTNDEISRYFGLYNDKFFEAESDLSDIIDKSKLTNDDKSKLAKKFRKAWKDIYKKISEKRASWIFDKINKKHGMSLQNGIMAYPDRKENILVFKDEYVDEWNSLQKEYMNKKNIKSIPDIVDSGLWNDMLEYISEKFSEYDLLKKVRKIEFDVSMLEEYDIEECERCRISFNDMIVGELIDYFSKRLSDKDFKIYKHMINKYVKIEQT